MLKIEKGVPIPLASRRIGMKCPYPFDQMEEGDSFVLPLAPNDIAKRAAHRVRTWALSVGKGTFSIAIRPEADGKSLRVWRTAPRAPRKPRAKPLAGIAQLVPEPPVRVHRLSDEEPRPQRAGGRR